MTHEQQLKNPLYVNWVKVGLALKYLKDGLEHYVDDEMRSLQIGFLNDIHHGAICTQCTTSSILPCPTYGVCNIRKKAGICSYHDSNTKTKRKQNTCPTDVCNKVYNKIIDQHRYSNPSWKNADASQWCTNHWEIAKCFLPAMGYEHITSAAETDCSGILSVILNCLKLQSSLDLLINPPKDVLSKLIKMRNIVLHSASLEVKDEQLTIYIDDMISLLQDKKKLSVNLYAKNAIDKLTQLKDGEIRISAEDERHIRTTAVEDKRVAMEIIQTCQTEVLEELKQLKIRQDIVEARLGGESESNEKMNRARNNYYVDHFYCGPYFIWNKEQNSTVQRDLKGAQSIPETLPSSWSEQQLQQKNSYSARKKELQETLCSVYEEHLSTISISPILEEIEANIDDVFVELVICDDLIHEPKKLKKRTDTGKIVDGYRDILYRNGKICKNVYVIGNAGMGKTTWCMKLLNTWVSACQKSEGQNKNDLTDDELTLTEFDIVLFSSLRHATQDGNILDMINHQLLVKYQHLEKSVTEIFEKESRRCLIVLDGLDEWTPPDSFVQELLLHHPDLPGKADIHDCTIVTTTRPWKLETVRLKERDIDRAVKLQGLQDKDLLTKRLIEQLNENVVSANGDDTELKSYSSFKRDVYRTFHQHTLPTFMSVPLILTFMVCLWFDQGKFEESLASNYSRLIEFFITNAEGNKLLRKHGRLFSVRNLETLKKEWSRYADVLPNCLKRKHFCALYAGLLLKLANLAFDTLFDTRKENNLVFNAKTLAKVLTEEELEVSVRIGILSQSKIVGKTLTKLSSLSFLHKTLQEYLAAIHIVCSTERGNQDTLQKYMLFCSSWSNVQEMENILLFVCGMNSNIASKMSDHVAIVSLHLNSWMDYYDKEVQDLSLKCVQEVQSSNGDIHRYPIHISALKLELNTSKEFLQQLSLLQTNRNNLNFLKVSFQEDGTKSDEFRRRKHMILEQLEQMQHITGLTELRLNNIQFSQGPMHWLTNSICQMSKLRRLKLCKVICSQTSEANPLDINLTSCCYIEKLKCKAMSHFTLTLNSSNLRHLKLEEIRNCTVDVMQSISANQVHKKSKMESISCIQAKQCDLNLLNSRWRINQLRLDGCDESVFAVRTGNSKQTGDKPHHELSYIETLECRSLTKCEVVFSDSIISNNIALKNCKTCSLSFQWQQCQHVTLEGLHESDKMSYSVMSSLKESSRLRNLRCSDLPTTFLEQILKHILPSLESLEVFHVSEIHENRTSVITPTLTQTPVEHNTRPLTQLREVRCTRLPASVWTAMADILPTLTQLEVLYLSDCGNMTSLAVQSLRHLTRLHTLTCSDLSKKAWGVLGNILPTLTRLKKLDLSDRYLYFQIFKKCGQNVQYELFIPPSLIDSLKQLPQLRYLCCRDLSEPAWVALGDNFPSLKQLQTLELSVSYNRFEISQLRMPSTVVQCLHHLKNLKHLICAFLPLEAWKALCTVLPSLEEFEILELRNNFDNPHMPPSVIWSLQQTPYLKELSCVYLSETAFQALAETFPVLVQLEKLELGDSIDTGRMPKSVIQSIQYLKRLKHLKCANLSNTGWAALCVSLQELRQLEILEIECLGSMCTSAELSGLFCLKEVILHTVGMNHNIWESFEESLPNTRHVLEVKFINARMDKYTLDIIKSSSKFPLQLWERTYFRTRSYNVTLKTA